jgi:4-oxalocrotonate tautomerase
MPVVIVNVWRGFSDDSKREVIEGITRVFTELGIPAEAVEIIINEVPMENWGVAGMRASEKFRGAKIP